MNDPTNNVCAVFVYGTLKRGQCREQMWPLAPRSVQYGWTYGDLYGRADYPAMIQGSVRVKGEIWTFLPKQFGVVLDALDSIEGTDGNSPLDLYHRHMVVVHVQSGLPNQHAHSYFYHRDPISDGFKKMPIVDGFQSWP